MSAENTDVSESHDRASIPKFKSFKKAATDAKAEVKYSTANVDEKRTSTKRRSNADRLLNDDRNLKKDRYASEQQVHRNRHRSNPSLSVSALPDRISGKEKHEKTTSEVDISHSRYYVVDRHGDRDNLSYGRPNQYTVPSYSRTGQGGILGLGVVNKINHNLSSDKAIVTYNPADFDHGRSRGLLRTVQQDKELRVTSVSNSTETWNLNKDYVSLLSRGSKTIPVTSEASEGDRDIDDLSITQHRNPKDKSEGSPCSSSGHFNEFIEAKHGDDSATKIKERNAQLSHAVKAEPFNLSAWLDLAEHQEDMAKLNHNLTNVQLASHERTALAEVRLSILEEALREIGQDQTKRTCLLEKIMTEGSKVWDTKTTFSRWQQYLKLYPTAVELWRLYLDFIQSKISVFRFEQCKSAFVECLRRLAEAESNESLKVYRLYIILRFSVLARSSGYSELSIAIWQALLEFNLFRPTEGYIPRQVGAGPSTIIELFEEFWESEVPRIGEKGALGWKTYVRSGGDLPDPAHFTKSKTLLGDEHFLSFAEEENSSSKTNMLPSRSLDDVEDDDPFRVVLFSDIRDIITYSPAQVSGIVWVQAFLCFCNLPPLKYNEATRFLDSWWQDTFLRTCQVRRPDDGSLSLYPSIKSTLDTLLSDSFTIDDTLVPIEWVRVVLTSLSNVVIEEDLVPQYFLAFVYKNSAESLDQIAKGLLKRRSTNVKLLVAYGIIKYRTSRKISGERVFKSILDVSHRLPIAEKENLPFLWQAWAWEALNLGESDTAMHCVLQVCRAEAVVSTDFKEPATPQRIEIAEHAILDAISTSVLAKRTDYIITYTQCLAILKYLQNREDLTSALQCFQETSSLLSVHSLTEAAVNEINHQAQADFLQWHISTRKPFKPATARSTLAESVNLFPNNTKFLTLLFANEARFRIDDRIRAIIRDSVLGNRRETIIGWQFALWAEQNRGVEMGATIHSVRATFERSVDSDCCRHSPLIWHSYVLFEYERGDLHRAKTVFLRGLTHLPWVKSYMMLAFTHLRSAMSYEELRNVYYVMTEKELRLRIDLSKALRKHDEVMRHDESAPD